MRAFFVLVVQCLRQVQISTKVKDVDFLKSVPSIFIKYLLNIVFTAPKNSSPSRYKFWASVKK